MEVVNIRQKNLQATGYQDLNHWLEDPNHLYIGRNMSRYVPGAIKSKWHNPFPVKQYGLTTCLELFEKHIRDTPELYNSLNELKGKVLGCWCKPNPCHGDVLIRLLNEKPK